MNACQIIQRLTPALGHEIISYVRDNQKDVYRAVLTTLAGQRKLRPQFVQKKSREQQAAWILESLKFRQSEGVGAQLLQVWLMKGQSAMLVQFLNALGIAHDGQGAVEELPQTLDTSRFQPALDELLARFPAENAAVYLHVFNLQQPGGWPEITRAIETDPRLALGSAPAGSASATDPPSVAWPSRP